MTAQGLYQGQGVLLEWYGKHNLRVELDPGGGERAVGEEAEGG
jgi:hypothetical protein